MNRGGDTQTVLLMVHLVSCTFMTGVIWVVQLILYPAFAQINSPQFQAFHANHSEKITFIVGPMMVIEILTAAALVYFSKDSGFFIFNLLAIILIWLCTFFLSVPIHAALEKTADYQLMDQLVKTNWPRTLLWSFRSLSLAVYFVATAGVFRVDI